MTPQQRHEQGEKVLASTDWNSYDYQRAQGADLSFPDFAPGPHNREIWLSKHYNPTPNMQSIQVVDLNEILSGRERRNMALYGVPMMWTDRKQSEYVARIAKIDEAKSAGPEMHAQWLGYFGMVNEEHFEFIRERFTGKKAAPAPQAKAAPAPARAPAPAPAPAPVRAPARAPAPAPMAAAPVAAPMAAPAPAPMPAPAPAAPPPVAPEGLSKALGANMMGGNPPPGATFNYNGETRPLPQGWEGLSMEDWFYKFETLRDRFMNIDEENLPHMTDEDGDDLDPEEVLIIHVFGFKSGGDYEVYRNWMVANWAAQTGESPTDCEFRMGGIARERIMAEKAGAMSGAGGPLEPFEGISLEAWAHINAKIAGGGDAAALYGAQGMDQAKWDRVNAEWNARMAADTTFAIATAYGNAFSGAGGGQFSAEAGHAADVGVGGDLSQEPCSYEKYVEIMEAQNAAYQRGEDAAACLATFGFSVVDWSNVGMFWSKKTQQEAMKYHELFIQYSAKYQAKYGTGDGLTQDQREEMILAKIMEMAGNGQAQQILPYLKDYFPDDAEDMDALDWWIDKCCDMCEESGDRARAQQLLPIRYLLQEDEEDPMEVWVASQMESLF
jgi:hypothetical protein